MGLIMPFAAVWLEEQLTARSISARRVRQLGSGGALSLAACSIIVFASTNTFRVAAAAHVGVVFALSFHTLGYYHGYTEIGGANSGLLAGIGNQIANMAGAYQVSFFWVCFYLVVLLPKPREDTHALGCVMLLHYARTRMCMYVCVCGSLCADNCMLTTAVKYITHAQCIPPTATLITHILME